MRAIIRFKIIRQVHSLVSKDADTKLKRIVSYINNYDDNLYELKRKKEYLGLLKNIYHTIPSRLNENKLWNNFLNKLKSEKCYHKLKKIIKKNIITHDSLMCRQIIYLYYIGFDDEIGCLIKRLDYKLQKCNEKDFKDCEKYMNEDVSDIIKMLYVLYHYKNGKDKDYKNIILYFDKYIYHSKNIPMTNLKYLFYFHLFYFNMNYSLIRIEKCLERHGHLLTSEQLMFLIRYINIYLKNLYLYNVIKHRNDYQTVCNNMNNKTNEIGNDNNGNNYEDENSYRNKIKKEINIFINNLFRINKNEKEYFIFYNFDDIEIKKNKCVGNEELDMIEQDNVSILKNEINERDDNKKGNHHINDNIYFDMTNGDKENVTIKDNNNNNNNNNKDNILYNNILYNTISSSDKNYVPFYIDKNQMNRKNSFNSNNCVNNNMEGLTIQSDENNNLCNSRKVLRKEKIIINNIELNIYKNIYKICTKEVIKNILLNKEKINIDILWNSFISNLFKDEYIYILMNEIKKDNKKHIVNEEEFITYLKQIKLLELYDDTSFITICNNFFKTYIVEKKYIKNLYFADRLTYYTDIFCYNSFLQKYILYIYKLNLERFNIKILKKILSKLFYFLQQNKSLINGFDKFIKSLIIKIIMNGSFNDIIMIIYTWRQYIFYKTYMNEQREKEKCFESKNYYMNVFDDINNVYNNVNNSNNWNNSNNMINFETDPHFVYKDIQKKIIKMLCLENIMDGNQIDETKYHMNNKYVYTELYNNHMIYNNSFYIQNNNIFHLSNTLLHYMKKDYIKIYEFLCFRTIIEKRQMTNLMFDKYFDKSMIIMTNKQLIKLFSVFLNKLHNTIKSGDNKFNLFECVNNFFHDDPMYYNMRQLLKEGSDEMKVDQPLNKKKNKTNNEGIQKGGHNIYYADNDNTYYDDNNNTYYDDNDNTYYDDQNVKGLNKSKQNIYNNNNNNNSDREQMRSNLLCVSNENNADKEKTFLIKKKKKIDNNFINEEEKEFIENKIVENKCKESFDFLFNDKDNKKKKKIISLSDVVNYKKKYAYEYLCLNNFINLLLMIIIDNYIFFDIKNLHFINFFFQCFEYEHLLSMSIYHYFYFFHIFKNINYSHLRQKDKKEYIYSEDFFNKNKNKIMYICKEKIKNLINEHILFNLKCGYSMTEINKEKKKKKKKEQNETCLEQKKNVEQNETCHKQKKNVEQNETCHKQKKNVEQNQICLEQKNVEPNETCLEQKNIINFDLDCIIMLILYNMNKEDVVDIFKNCFLLSLNNYLMEQQKKKKREIIFIYSNTNCSIEVDDETKMEIREIKSNDNNMKDKMASCSYNMNQLNIIPCNNFDMIRKIFDSMNKNIKYIDEFDIIKKYEFFYIHMIYKKLMCLNNKMCMDGNNFKNNDDMLKGVVDIKNNCNLKNNYACNNIMYEDDKKMYDYINHSYDYNNFNDYEKEQSDYNSFLHFLSNKKQNYEAEELLKLCTMIKMFKGNDKIKQIINKINMLFNSYNSFEFFISYLFLIILNEKKENYINQIYKIFNEINIYLLNNNIKPYWYQLLIQILYLIKIKNLYSFDLLCIKYKNIANFYYQAINIKKNKLEEYQKKQKKQKKTCTNSNINMTYYINNGQQYNIYRSIIRKYLQTNNISYIENIQLKDSPFIFDIYIPSKKIIFLNQDMCIFPDIFIDHLQVYIFDTINFTICQMNERNYNILIGST
ncbi:hypothetical protein PGSY75_0309900 [Plasmodium gaboni]|uniref:Uncharacterized protein n=1 Tax=Plasmodium gaboni TaxID=647221 RepID=A0A151LVL4_9APIC|nr:hypothetical protein PGSY75_0309900 [Plasmodium gaboni]KYO03214.1 hypothetical protein PGSY75_0309900 [Plasmodium gaboni]